MPMNRRDFLQTTGASAASGEDDRRGGGTASRAVSVTADLFAAIDATWPPERLERRGPVTLRLTEGGGSRVRAASVAPGWTREDLDAAEAAMQAAGQPLLWQVRPGQTDLDDTLAARGYRTKDPVTGWIAPVEALMDQPRPRVRTFEVWPPLACQREIWAEGGIGPDRLEVRGCFGPFCRAQIWTRIERE